MIKRKLIKNAGLDVFEKEPINKKNKLLSINNNFYRNAKRFLIYNVFFLPILIKFDKDF